MLEEIGPPKNLSKFPKSCLVFLIQDMTLRLALIQQETEAALYEEGMNSVGCATGRYFQNTRLVWQANLAL